MAGRVAALSLYRSILRAHADYLPPHMRRLGDAYVRTEFRQHRSATNPEQLGQFFHAWGAYLDQMRQTGRARGAASTGALDGSATGVSSFADPVVVSEIGEGKEEESASSSPSFKFGRHLPKDAELSEDQVQRLEQLRRNVALDVAGTGEKEQEVEGGIPKVEHWKTR